MAKISGCSWVKLISNFVILNLIQDLKLEISNMTPPTEILLISLPPLLQCSS